MNLSIIIVTYKSKGFINACIKSLLDHIPSELIGEIIVVENNSGDGIASVISGMHGVRFIDNKENLGFSRGNNIGVQIAKGKYIFFANPDIFLQNDAIKILYDFMEAHPNAAACGPRLIYPDGTDQESARNFPKPFSTILAQRTFLGNTSWGRTVKRAYNLHGLSKEVPSKVPWLVGAALFVRRSCLDKVGGGFDERYFMYYEDIDLSRQFWHKNFEVWYVPTARITHFHKRASAGGGWFPFRKKIQRIHIASAFKYFIKWRGIKEPLCFS